MNMNLNKTEFSIFKEELKQCVETRFNCPVEMKYELKSIIDSCETIKELSNRVLAYLAPYNQGVFHMLLVSFLLNYIERMHHHG